MTHPPLTRVLVPLDSSPRAAAALEEAFRLFPEADVLALHVIQVVKVAGDGSRSGTELAVETAEEIREAAEATAVSHRRHVDVDLIEGNVAKTIVTYAEEYDIDHQVIGSRGRSGLKRLLPGSVSAAVVSSAPCPVTVVPPRRNERAD